MRLHGYSNGHVKRTYFKATLKREEFERLLAVSGEWELVEVKGNQAVFKSVKP